MTQMPHQQPPHQPQAPQGGNGHLRLHLQGNFLTNMITPTATLDGQLLPAKYGESNFPVVPGPHRIDVHAQWMWKYGQASQEIYVQPGQVVDVWYAPPLLTFLKGAIGPTKQKMPGLFAFVAIFGGVFVVMLLLMVVAAVAGNG